MRTSGFEPKRFGRYLLLEKFAQGGMAELFRAKITGVQGFEKFIAIKWILPHLAEEKELVGSFIDEAKLAALLNHHNIVQIYDFGQLEDSYFISMEYLFGKDIRRIFDKSKEKSFFTSTEYALHITARICSALDYAHKLKDYQGNLLHIIHRDVSPQNIFVTYEGDVKILDFGIAKAATQSSLTQVGMIKGKVAYMSPEQAAGQTIDHRSDIFSTGILLYEMLTNMRMFTGDTMQVLALVREAKIPWPETIERDMPQQILEILRHALTKEPEDRYQSCGEMLADIEKSMIELAMTPTTQGLAQYMKELFEEEIAAESNIMREADIISVEEPLQVERPGGKIQEQVVVISGWKLQRERIKKFLNAAVEAIREELQKERIKKSLNAAAVAIREELQKGRTKKFLYAVGAILVVSGLVVALLTGGSNEGLGVSDPKEQIPAIREEAERLMETEPQEALPLLRKWITLDPTNVDAHSLLGSVHQKLEEYPKATEAYEKAAALDPKSADVYSQLGLAYAKLEEYPKATEAYEKAAALDPESADVYSQLGLAYAKLEDYPKAIEAYEKAAALDPKSADVHSQLGLACVELEEYAKAAEAYQKAAALDPESIDVYSQLGRAYVKLEDYPKAIEAYERAAALDPESVDVHSQLGRAYVKLEDYPNAIEAYEKAAALDPESADVYFGLGYVYVLSEDYAKAEEMYGKTVKLSPPYKDDALFNLAIVQARQGKLEQSKRNLEEAMFINSEHPYVREYLDRVLRRLREAQ